MEIDDNKLHALSYGGRLTIDLAAVKHNYSALMQQASPAEVSAVVKANAYGLGLEKIASTLYAVGCRYYFVAQLSEAITLSQTLPSNAKIAILNGVQKGGEMLAAEAGFLPVLNSLDDIKQWQALCLKAKKAFPAMIQIDVGMSRLGLDSDDLKQLIAQPAIFDIANITFIIGHLSTSEDPKNPSNLKELNTLTTAIQQLPTCPVALANSGGVFLDKAYSFHMVRAGIALYGIAPQEQHSSALKPVVRLDARVIQTRAVAAGTKVGYGGTFTTKRPSKIATIAIGYSDGWHRSLSNKGSVYFNNARLPIIGTISMDSMTVDITDLGHCAPHQGDYVELIGPNQTAADVARDAGTISYEILTSLGQRYDRRYIAD